MLQGLKLWYNELVLFIFFLMWVGIFLKVSVIFQECRNEFFFQYFFVIEVFCMKMGFLLFLFFELVVFFRVESYIVVGQFQVFIIENKQEFKRIYYN